MNTALAWFRDDLRVADHPALLAAARDGAAVALYVLDEESDGVRPLGGAARWWLHQALADLRQELGRLGIPLILRRGPASEVVPAVVNELGAGALFWNTRYGGPERAIDSGVEAWARSRGVHVESFQASLLHEPSAVRTGQGNPYQVFTPFWRAVSTQDIRAPHGEPEAGQRCSARAASEDPDVWRLAPTDPDWASGLRDSWTPTAAAAHGMLAEFAAAGMTDYADSRDRPDLPGTSRLSPYLRWGQLSPFQVWAALAATRANAGDGARVFASQLGWREFCWHQLYHHPDLSTQNLRPRFDDCPWARPDNTRTGSDGERLRAWQTGITGLPLVDAGQRELWHTGFMHNRVRMVSASFLVKNLGIHWQVGEQWFWDTLVDADAASNPANWQWVAGSGADASPFFRIFNPETQARKFDPAGDYVHRWVPEAGTPAYPEPMVDLRDTRAAALTAYDTIR